MSFIIIMSKTALKQFSAISGNLFFLIKAEPTGVMKPGADGWPGPTGTLKPLSNLSFMISDAIRGNGMM